MIRELQTENTMELTAKELYDLIQIKQAELDLLKKKLRKLIRS